MAGESPEIVKPLTSAITADVERDLYPDWIEILDRGNLTRWDAVLEIAKADIDLSGLVYPLTEEYHVSQTLYY
jgi:hypothetical protein